MMRLWFLIGLLLVSMAAAQPLPVEKEVPTIQDILDYLPELNEKIDEAPKLPGFARFIIGTEAIGFSVEENGSIDGFVLAIEKGEFKQFVKRSELDPTIEIVFEKSAFDSFMTADDKGTSLIQMVKNKKVKVLGHTMGARFKVLVLRVGLGFVKRG